MDSRRLGLVFGALIISIVLGVLIVELIARLVYGPPAVRFLTPASRDTQSDFDVTYGVKRDRSRVTCAAPDNPGRIIAFIGDSFVFGQGVPDMDDFVARVSCHLPAAKVLNLGAIGADFFYYEMALRSLVPSNTDDIVLLVYENDTPPPDWEGGWWTIKRILFRWSHFATMSMQAKEKLSRFLHRKAIQTYTVNGKFNNPKTVVLSNPGFFKDLAHPSGDDLNLFDKTLRRFILESHRIAPKARLFVSFAPEASTVSRTHRDFYRSLAEVPLPTFGEPSALYRRTEAVCRATQGCIFIDLFPMLLASGDLFYFLHDFHWNPAGHAAVAEAILKVLAAP